MPRLFLTRRAQRDLDSLPAALREAVVETLTVIEADPERTGKALVGRLRGTWSAAIGAYRILYTIERERVIVRANRHRGVAYRRRRR